VQDCRSLSRPPDGRISLRSATLAHVVYFLVAVPADICSRVSPAARRRISSKILKPSSARPKTPSGPKPVHQRGPANTPPLPGHKSLVKFVIWSSSCEKVPRDGFYPVRRGLRLLTLSLFPERPDRGKRDVRIDGASVASTLSPPLFTSATNAIGPLCPISRDRQTSPFYRLISAQHIGQHVAMALSILPDQPMMPVSSASSPTSRPGSIATTLRVSPAPTEACSPRSGRGSRALQACPRAALR